MATGTSGDLLDNRDKHAQSIFKHAILRQYLPRFIAMPGSTASGGRLVVLDGFAGRGRYPDGTPASAELILRAIRSFRNSRDVSAVFVERKPDNFAELTVVVNEYAKQGLRVRSCPGQVEDHLEVVVQQAAGLPLFLFLDPCGAGLPYDRLRDVLRGPRHARRPQTEVLLNFSADLTRRATGALNKGMLDEPIISRMDTTCGGDWWRETALGTLRSPQGKNFEAAAHAVAQEYAGRVSRDTSMTPVVIPVGRRLGQQPIYHLVFLTRSSVGLWEFADAVGRARRAYLDHLGNLDGDNTPGQQGLFGDAEDNDMEWLIKQEHDEAVGVIKANLRALVRDRGDVKLVEHTRDVFGKAYGFAVEPAVTEAVKNLRAIGELVVKINHGKLRNRTLGPPTP
ncbi:three-Cys-motif partner protein TcmP [Actinomadura sp. LOL_016]|uniref:three-Cys-motif partner protein TcmP n=1 Tax=unclassified Actinomadura TaxID=2626254 RepID=UPI003A7F8FE4